MGEQVIFKNSYPYWVESKELKTKKQKYELLGYILSWNFQICKMDIKALFIVIKPLNLPNQPPSIYLVFISTVKSMRQLSYPHPAGHSVSTLWLPCYVTHTVLTAADTSMSDFPCPQGAHGLELKL